MLGFYEKSIVELEAVITEITARLEVIRKYRKINNDRDPIEYIKSRIKSEESMKEKLKRKGLEVNLENALTKIHDAAGIRIICTFADDVEELAETVGTMLEYNNYEVDIVYNGKDAFDKAKEEIYDCIILDVMMPIMDGFEVVKKIRKLNIKTPIILLTAKSMIDDKVEGLDLGANDYITKPFEKKELLARIRALTRIEEEHKEKYEIGNLIFNKESSQLSKNKTSLNLSKQECDIIELFIKNPERKISKDELKQRIWTNEQNTDNIVPMYMTFLQEKFKALNANIIINDIEGYKLEKII